MPLRHSPRASPRVPHTTGPRAQDDSESNASDNGAPVHDDLSTKESNITMRKRKRSDEDFSIMRLELEASIKKIEVEQERKFSMILTSVNEIKEQNKDIMNTIEFMSNKYDELLLKINTLETKYNSSKLYIQTLENKIDQYERNQRSSCIELRNIPYKSSETKTDLCSIIKKAGSALSIPIEVSDLRDVYRIASKTEKYKPILAEFSSTILKENLLKSLRAHNRQNNKRKFNTLDLGFDGPAEPVYIAESLPHKARMIYAHARKFAKKNNYVYCWTSYGKIYLRKHEGGPRIRVESEECFAKLLAI